MTITRDGLEFTWNTIVEVPVSWLLRNITGSVDGYPLDEDSGWTWMMSSKCADTSFGNIVESILAVGFTDPIVLVPDHETGGFSQGNGHHRLCAAILMALDSIPVYFTRGDYMAFSAGLTSEVYAGVDMAGDWPHLVCSALDDDPRV